MYNICIHDVFSLLLSSAGWFYVKKPPSERSMLIGTFGTNDAVTLYSNSNRPRRKP